MPQPHLGAPQIAGPPAEVTVLDAGPAPDAAVCLRLLAETEVGCWFDRRATAGTSLLMVDPIQMVRTTDAIWSALGARAGADVSCPCGFAGGWAGWVSYAGGVVGMGLTPQRVPGHADAALGYYPACLAVDHGNGRALAVGRGEAGRRAAEGWIGRLQRARSAGPDGAFAKAGGPRVIDAGPARGRFVEQVREVQRWITAGDTYVANLSYRVRLESLADPTGAYALLAAAQRAPYAALARDGHHWVLSCSPELLLRRLGARTWTRPIKGTRPAGRASGATLAADPKERAELTMIVDMERNDLGRVARTGSVRVPELFAVERHPGLDHLVATVEAEVHGAAGTLLLAMLPGGSVTGAPKYRAVERLAGLEADARGVYTGTVGYCDDGGDMEWNVAIRTLESTPGGCLYGTGGGITVDSDPEREYQETLLKARGPLRALGVAWP